MRLFIYYTILLFLLSCSSVQHTKVDRRYSNIYNPQVSYLYPKYLVYHSSDLLSTLIVKAYPKQFLFSLANEDQIYKAEFDVEFTLKEIIDGVIFPEIADSGIYHFEIKKENEQNYFHANIPVRAEKGKVYAMEVIMTDLQRRVSSKEYILVDKKDPMYYQNFLFTDLNSRYPEFPPLLIGNKGFRIRSINDFDTLKFSYYQPDDKKFHSLDDTASLPVADSVWNFKNSKNNVYVFAYPGIYYMQDNSGSNKGVALFNFGSDYPRISSAVSMVEPVSLFATDKEVETLRNATNTKFAVDNFWLEKAGNLQRAREMIRIYYNRVFLANMFFTSFEEGWKTDRGKVYVILGPPDAISRTFNQERWIYTKENNNYPSIYVFDREEHLFTDNHFKVNASQTDANGFKKVLNSWRTGEVFLIEQ